MVMGGVQCAGGAFCIHTQLLKNEEGFRHQPSNNTVFCTVMSPYFIYVPNHFLIVSSIFLEI